MNPEPSADTYEDYLRKTSSQRARDRGRFTGNRVEGDISPQRCDARDGMAVNIRAAQTDRILEEEVLIFGADPSLVTSANLREFCLTNARAWAPVFPWLRSAFGSPAHAPKPKQVPRRPSYPRGHGEWWLRGR